MYWGNPHSLTLMSLLFVNGRCIPTPSTSLNRALEALCLATAHVNLSPAQMSQTLESIISTYSPETTGAGRINAEQLESWFEDLSADEYLVMSGLAQNVNPVTNAPWS